jgi:hypothetical protein
MIIGGTGATHATQVDFCPYCGTELSTQMRFGYRKPSHYREKRAVANAPYYEYRRRFAKSGKPAEPMTQTRYYRTLADLHEIEFLLEGDAGVHQSELFAAKQAIYRDLYLPDLRPERGRLVIAQEPLPDFGTLA